MNLKNFLILIFLTFTVANCEYSKPVYEFFPDMYDSPARESQEMDNYLNSYGRRLPPDRAREARAGAGESPRNGSRGSPVTARKP